VGVNVYVTFGIADQVPIETIFRGAFPFLIALVLLLGLVLFIPQIALFLPELLRP
jgi:TRAP-type C4-dicarboxylate transport system permease large subunit